MRKAARTNKNIVGPAVPVTGTELSLVAGEVVVVELGVLLVVGVGEIKVPPVPSETVNVEVAVSVTPVLLSPVTVMVYMPLAMSVAGVYVQLPLASA